jgi:hypothetical protein
MRKGEAEFAEGVNPELRSTIEKAIGQCQVLLSDFRPKNALLLKTNVMTLFVKKKQL